MRITRYILLALLCVFVLVSSQALAQSSSAFNQRDDKYRLLGLKRAREAYVVARSEYERQEALFDRELITKVQIEQAHNRFADAEVNYQQSMLAVLFEEQYVSVSGAVKYHSSDGRRHVRLTLANLSGGSSELRQLMDSKDDLFRSLQPDVVHNIYVSLLNDAGAVISQPYETKIDQLRFGQPQTVDFTLLQDVDIVTVYLIYSNGTERNMTVYLQKDNSVDRVAVQSEQFSQEIELGKAADFDLTLEQFSGSQNTYRLDVVNLPRQISRYFSSSGSQARLSQIKFTESSNTKRAALHVELPDRPDNDVIMDSSIIFYVLVYPCEESEKFSGLSKKYWEESEIKALGIGYARLELIPRGRGELRVRAPLLFYSIAKGEEVDMNLSLFNEGSHRIDNIEVKAELPLNWRSEIIPPRVPSLEISEEVPVNLTFVPPDDISEGRYEIRLRSSGSSNSQPVNGVDKTITVEIRSETNVVGASLLVLLLLGTVGGMVIFGVRLSRR